VLQNKPPTIYPATANYQQLWTPIEVESDPQSDLEDLNGGSRGPTAIHSTNPGPNASPSSQQPWPWQGPIELIDMIPTLSKKPHQSTSVTVEPTHALGTPGTTSKTPIPFIKRTLCQGLANTGGVSVRLFLALNCNAFSTILWSTPQKIFDRFPRPNQLVISINL